MKIHPTLLAATTLALLAGCGGDVLTVQGTASVSTTVAGQAPTQQSFDFNRATALAAGSGMLGSCSVSNGQWSIALTRESAPAGEFKQMTLVLPPAVAGQARLPPNATFVLGDATFTASGSCTDTSSATSGGVHVVVHCTGAHATGDSRVLSADVNLVFSNCAQ